MGASGATLKSHVDVPIHAGTMAHLNLTDDEYRLVATVAEREGWVDLAKPVVDAARPRTIAEQQAVLRFAAAIPGPRLSSGWNPRWARGVMLAIGAVGLLVCWLISPERTALGLLFVGVFCLIGLRRRGRAPGAGASRRAGRGGIPMLTGRRVLH